MLCTLVAHMSYRFCRIEHAMTDRLTPKSLSMSLCMDQAVQARALLQKDLTKIRIRRRWKYRLQETDLLALLGPQRQKCFKAWLASIVFKNF